MIWYDMKALMFWKKVKEEEIVTNKREFEVDEEGFTIVTYTHRQILKERSMLINYPVGSDVICKSNETSLIKEENL